MQEHVTTVRLLSTTMPTMHGVDRDACLQPHFLQVFVVPLLIGSIIQAAAQLPPVQCNPQAPGTLPCHPAWMCNPTVVEWAAGEAQSAFQWH